MQHWLCSQDMVEKHSCVLIPFATKYLYANGFNSLLSIKTKSRNHLNPGAELVDCCQHESLRFDNIMNESKSNREIGD